VADDRELAPSTRRRALAHQAGATPHAPGLTAAAAWLGALAGASWTASHGRLDLAAGIDVATRDAVTLPSLRGALAQLGALSLPILGGALLAAMLVHVVQVRRAWLPRRRIDGAPVAEASAARRSGDVVWAAVRVAIVIGAAGWWLVGAAPALASAPIAPAAIVTVLTAGALTIAAALVVAGVLDLAVVWWRAHLDLRQTAAERREELATAGAAQHRRRHDGFAGVHVAASPAGAVRRARVVLTDGSRAVALAIRGDAPEVTACGRGADAFELLALARRYDVPLHRDAALVAALVDSGLGRAPAATWPALAELVAALAPRAA